MLKVIIFIQSDLYHLLKIKTQTFNDKKGLTEKEIV